MAQAPSQLQQFTHWLESASLQIADSKELQRLSRSIQKNSLLKKLRPAHLWGTTIALSLILWNWQLVLALAIGAIALTTVYLAPQKQWHLPAWQTWTSKNRSLTIAIATGTIATLSTYITTHIWLEADRSWLATGIILQGFGTLSILLFLIYQALDRSNSSKPSTPELLTQLSEPEPLKRLIAIRQLTQQAQQNAAPLPPAQIADCFRLMLNRETEPSVCSALLDSLQTLGQGRQLNAAVRQSVTIATQRQKVPE